jgi:hypothetical protein
MRLFLYRHTGRVEAWQYLDVILGGYPVVEALEDVRAAWKVYRGNTGKFFTNAYLVFPQSDTPGTDKLDSIINLAQRLFTPGSPDDVMPDWQRALTQRQRFDILRRNKGVGDFMAMQVLTDWGYLQPIDREDDFLVPGPGSRKGAKALAPNTAVDTTIKNVVLELRTLPECPQLGYRVPSLMDAGSNLTCEWSKYVRYKNQPIPAKPYIPAHPGPQPAPVLPSYYPPIS